MSLPKKYSLNSKILILFAILGVFLLSILFVQIIPNMLKEQKQSKKQQIKHLLDVTNEQIKLGTQLLIQDGEKRHKKVEQFFKDNIKDIENDISLKNKQDLLSQMSEKLKCEITSINQDKQVTFSSSGSFIYKDIFNKVFDEELFFETKDKKHMCPTQVKSLMYKSNIESLDESIIIQCSVKNFRNKHMDLENRVKDNLKKSFKLTSEDHQGKINLIWINTKHSHFSTKPLYHFEDKAFNNKYCLSKMSISALPKTGLLTPKQIIDAIDGEPIYHMMNTDSSVEEFSTPALTWVRSISNKNNRHLVFLTTIYEKDFNRDFYTPLLKILPAAFFSFVIAIILGLFLFKRLFKSINILTNTAKQINEGKIDIRNNLKGNDDIAILANTFDSMLDSIEKNISELDSKVEYKTLELRNSLEEKETLLKEIHHRVKNNLAMIIELIKIQKSKLKDPATKEALVDIQERVFTMELLHRKLYESRDLHFIDFKKYVLDLVDDLNYSYGSQKDIKINIDIEDLNMSVEYALPCGLIINECITNSFKYAFDNDTGEISISLVCDDEKCILKISDNGKGIDKSIDIHKPKTLGLKLISTIVKSQLLGNIEYSNKNGSIFFISFEIS